MFHSGEIGKYLGIASGIGEGLVMIFLLTILGLIGWLVFDRFRYKHKVRVREIVRGRVIIKDDKAKEWKDKHGTKWWKLLKLRDKFPEPPAESVDLDSKGKKVYECYKSEDGAYIPIRDAFKYDEYKKQIKEMHTVEGNHSVTGFQPLTTQERALMIEEVELSNRYNKRKQLHELISQAIPYVSVIMIFAFMLIFWGDAIAPAQEFGNKLVEASGNFNDAIEICMQGDRGQVLTGGEVNQLNNGGGAPN